MGSMLPAAKGAYTRIFDRETRRVLTARELFQGLNNDLPGCYMHTICPREREPMTEAHALGLLFVLLLFVAYSVWDLSHHR